MTESDKIHYMKSQDLLLITDMQNVYLENQTWACLDTHGAAANILKIARSLPEKNVLITEFLPPKNFGAWETYNKKYAEINSSVYLNQLIPEIEALSSVYPLYKKSVYSSMKIPQVKKRCIKATKAGGRILVTGVVAECCVLSTVFDAMDYGCKLIYLTDAVSGFTKEKEDAVILTLSGLSPVHLSIMTTEEYLKEKF